MMTKLKIILFLYSGIFYKEVSAQTCIVKITDNIDFFKRSFNEEIDVFLSLEFEINKTQIKTVNLNSVSILPNDSGFDTIKYSYNYNGITYKDTFICKLRPEEIYTISPCTCCGIFLMTPSNNAGRGYVKYVNNSKKEFIAESGELQLDTIFKNKETDFIHSSISMNCGFRPNSILIAY